MKISNFEIFNCQVVKYLKFLTSKSPNKFSNCRNSPQWKFQISKFPIVKCLKFLTSKSPNKFSNCRNSNFEIFNYQVTSSCQVFEISKLQISKQIFELWKFQWKFQISKFPIVKSSQVVKCLKFPTSKSSNKFSNCRNSNFEIFNYQVKSSCQVFEISNLQISKQIFELPKFTTMKNSNFEISNCQVVKCLKFPTSKSPNFQSLETSYS